MAEQVTVGIREAAALLDCSPKRIRRMVRSGELRADLVRGRYGEEWRIERASLPSTLPAHKRQGRGSSDHTPSRAEAGILAGLLRDTQARLEAATALAGQLGGEREQRRELEARARSLVEAEAIEKARAESLAVEGERLRSALRSRTWALAILVAAFAVAVAAALLRV